jgi:hypothetical protein
MIHTRPDVCYAVTATSQFMDELRQRHWVETKHILRYLRGTITYSMRYTSIGGLFLHGYAYELGRKTGGLFQLGMQEGRNPSGLEEYF